MSEVGKCIPDDSETVWFSQSEIQSVAVSQNKIQKSIQGDTANGYCCLTV